MSTARQLESRLPEVLEEISAPRTPAYFDDILGQVGRTRQRPGWSFPERWLPMTAISERVAPAPRIPMRVVVALALLLLALALSIPLIAGSQRRVPPPYGPAGNGAVVIADGGDILLIDPISGNRTVAIGGPAMDSSPVFSRDGTRLAFYREEGGRRGLFVADARGRSPRELDTAGLVNPEWIEWSPDGAGILVNVDDKGKRGAAIVATDGSGARLVEVAMPVEDGVWLPPDGDEILFRTPGRVGFGLLIVRADGTGMRELLPATGANEWDALYFAPSPDGSQVAYQWRDVDGVQKIYVVSVAGGTSRALTTVESVLPRWSPDGSKIMFGSDDGVYVVPADGSTSQVRLVAEAGLALQTLWTPDGTRVLFIKQSGRPLLLDPAGGSAIEVQWGAIELPDWQRTVPAS
jgi:dipeptidyl aminopeptidase/acylaminoacyl peptidase